MAKKEVSTDQLITTILEGIEEVKGQNIDLLDLREIENMVCDYFIVCNGTSNTQVTAIVNSIQKFVSPILLWSDPAAPSGHHPSERREQSSSHSSKCQPPHTIVTTLYSGHSLQFRLYPRNRLRLEIEHYVISEDSAVNWCDVTI